jgi:hypothetical protein
MVMSQIKEKMKLRGQVPSLEEYWEVRMGTSAVGVIYALNEVRVNTAKPYSHC